MTEAPLTLLLAEDDANDQLLFTLALRKACGSMEVHLVEDGDQTIRYLEGDPPFSNRHEHPFPALMVLDLKMPRRDGFAVLDWLVWRPSLRPRFIVVLSASDRPEDVQRAKRLGADSYLIKPQDPAELVRLVRSLGDYTPEPAHSYSMDL